MLGRFDFYSAASCMALVCGVGWTYLAMAVLKIPVWPCFVAMAAFYAVGGNACHERHENFSKSLKGLLLGAVLSWAGVFAWSVFAQGNPWAMAMVMGIAAAIFVYITKWRFLGTFHFIAMPQAFLGATIYFGLLNTFMASKGVDDSVLFGVLKPIVETGGVQPHVAASLAGLSILAGTVLGWSHQHASFLIVHLVRSRREPASTVAS